MDYKQFRAVRTATESSHESCNNYLHDPSDRAAKIKALSDAKRLVIELQDEDDAFFLRNEHVSR